MSQKARTVGKAAPIDHPCSFQQPLCLWDMDEAPASVWGQTAGEVLGCLRTAFSVYNNCRVVAYNGSSSILTPKGSSAPVQGSHARLVAQLSEVVKHFLQTKIFDRGGCLILIGSRPDLVPMAAAARKAKCVVKYLYHGKEQCLPALLKLAQWTCDWSVWLMRLGKTVLPFTPSSAFKNGDIAYALEGGKKGPQPTHSGSLGSSPVPRREPKVGVGTSTAGSSDSAASTSKGTYPGTIQGFLDEHSQPTIPMQHSGHLSSLDTGFGCGFGESFSMPTDCAACRESPLRLEADQEEITAAYLTGFPAGSNLQGAETLAVEMLAVCRSGIKSAKALYSPDRRPFVTVTFSHPEAASIALKSFGSANDLLRICPWRVWRPVRCESCTLSRANSMARVASLTASSNSSRRGSSTVRWSDQGDPELDFDWDLPDLDPLGRIISPQPSFQYDQSFGARHDSATTIFPVGSSTLSAQSPKQIYPSAMSSSPDANLKQAASRVQPAVPISAFQQGSLMDSASTMYIQQAAAEVPAVSMTHSGLSRSSHPLPEAPQASQPLQTLPRRSPSPVLRASSGSPFVPPPSLKRTTSWAGTPLSPIASPHHHTRPTTPTPVPRPTSLQQPLQQLPEARSLEETCAHLSLASMHDDQHSTSSRHPEEQAHELPACMYPDSAMHSHSSTSSNPQGLQDQLHAQHFMRLVSHPDPALHGIAGQPVLQLPLSPSVSDEPWGDHLDRAQSGPLSPMQHLPEQLLGGHMNRAQSGPLSPMQQPPGQLPSSHMGRAESGPLPSMQQLPGQLPMSLQSLLPAASIASSDAGSTMGSGGLVSRASMSISKRRNSMKQVDPSRPGTPDLPRTAANRLVENGPAGIDLDPLAFADNGSEWRILQAFIMHAMFDDFGMLKPLWPELDDQLKLQAESWDKLATRDAVLGMSIHDEGAMLAQNARAEFESAFISLARLASSKVDLDLFRGIFSPAQLNYLQHYCRSAIADMSRRFGVHVYITPTCLRAIGKLVRIQVVLPHIKGTMEALHVGEAMTAMPLAKHLPASLVDAVTADNLKTFILRFFEEQEALLQTMYKVKLFVDTQPSAKDALLHVHVLSSHMAALAKVALRIKQEVAAWITCVTAVHSQETDVIAHNIAQYAASRSDLLAMLTPSNQLLISGRSAELVLSTQKNVLQGTSSGQASHGP
ncbi:hypothetical protein WJX74_009391 [Apatococcus lobatus]|uniref:Limkain-b1 n=1 Tax=Apatococcus lobatus TaxID=904363 RepID=A0AAW1RZF9_9CHLO